MQHLPPTISLAALILDVLQFILGAGLLGVFTYRVYNKRPKLDVPRTDAEIRAYKRTGRHPRPSGYSGYTIVYGTPYPWLITATATTALVALAASILLRRHASWTALLCAIAGLYCASVAGLILDELRRGRHVRLARLLDALRLSPVAHVLVVERLHGLLGVAAARRLPDGHADIVLPDLKTVEATRVNLRRANMASRAGADLAAAHRGSHDAVLLEVPAGIVRLHVLVDDLAPDGRAAIFGTRALSGPERRAAADLPLVWQDIPPAITDRLLAALTRGRIAPFARWAARQTSAP